MFANVRTMLDTATKSGLTYPPEVAVALSHAPEWLRKDFEQRAEIVRKYVRLMPQDIYPIELQIRSAFQKSDSDFFKAIIERESKTVILVLALYKELWENQKSLWKHVEEYNKCIMDPESIDPEIARIEEIAMNYGLSLPST